MTDSGLGRLSAGEPTVAFAPYAWEDLPGFVQSSAPAEWWLDPNFCQRALTDVGGVCRADAVLVPLLHERTLRTIGDRAEDAVELAAAITSLGEVRPNLDLVDQLVAMGRYDVVAVLPTLEDLGSVLEDCEPEDLEDSLSDLARHALDRRASAVAVRGRALPDTRRAVERLSAVAGYFGAQVIGTTPDEGWSSRGSLPIEIATVGGTWPQSGPTLVTTYVDLTTVATAPEVRRWVAERGGS